MSIACKNSRPSSLLFARDVSPEGKSTHYRQKYHTDDVNQCLHNKSGSQRAPNVNLFNFMSLLVDYGKVLFSSANELQQNSNALPKKNIFQENGRYCSRSIALTHVTVCLLSVVRKQ